MPVVSWALDASQVLAGSQQFQTAMGNINASVASSMNAMVNFNSQQTKYTQTIQGILDSGEKFQAKFSGNVSGGQAQIGQLKDLRLLGDEFQTVGEKGNNAGNSIFISWQRIGGVIQLQLWRQLVRTLEQAFSTGIAGATEFEMQISRIRTVSQDSDVSFNQWAQHIHDLSDKYGTAQKDVADAAIVALTSQTAKGADALRLLDTTLQFGNVTMLNAKDSATLVTSALNAFSISAQNADHVAAVLFETMNLGHIQGQQIASTMGRVNEIAHTLGLGLEETGAALATLTNLGVKPTEAMTLLSAVMEKLLRPSTDMKKLLDSWGTPTGEAAVATFGFAGVLNKLEAASHGSATELTNLFNQVRSSKGIQGLTLFSGYQENLEKIRTTADQAYDAAKKITDESPGRNLEKEWNAIKNFFVDDFGRAFIKVLSDVSIAVGGFHNYISGGTKVLGVLAAGVLTYRSGLTGLIPVLTAYGSGLTILNIQQTATAAGMVLGARSVGDFTTSLGLFSTQLFVTIAPVAALTAGAYALYKILYDTGEQAGKASTNLQRLREQAIKEMPVNLSVPRTQEIADDFKDSVNAVFGALLQQTATAYRAIDGQLTQLRQHAKEFGEELVTSFKTYMGRLQEDIANTRRAITEARAEIQSSLTSAAKFKETVAEARLQEQLKFATPEEAFGLLETKYRDTQKKFQQLFAEGTKESVSEARQAFTDAIRQLGELESKKKEIYENQFKNFRPENNDFIRQGTPGPYKGPSDDYYVRINSLMKERLNLEAQYRQELEKQITKFTQLEEAQKARVSNINQAAKDFFDLQKKLEAGDIYKDKRFQTNIGGPDPAKAIAAFEEAANRLKGLTQETDPQRALEFHAKLEAQKTNLTKIALVEREKISIDALQNDLKKQEELLIKAGQEQADATKKSAEAIAADKTGGIDKIKADLRDLLIVANVEGDKVSQVLKGVFNLKDNKIAESAEQRVQLISTLTGMITGLENLKKSADPQTPEGLKRIRDGLDAIDKQLPKVQAQLDAFIRARTGTNLGTKDVLVPGSDLVTAVNVLKDVTNQTDKMRESLSATEQAMRNFDTIKDIPIKAIQGASKETQAIMLNLLLQSDESTQKVGTNFQKVAAEIDIDIKKVQDLSRVIQDLGKLQITIPQIAQPVNIPAPNPGLPNDPFQGFAFGGEVLNGPRGSDNVPIWAQKGEFIVNADATKRFYAQLVAMNDSAKPGYYAQGGYITTNVGDINVSMTSSGSPQYDVRSLGKILRRELKRGTISFNR